jgi:hypothetical protein
MVADQGQIVLWEFLTHSRPCENQPAGSGPGARRPLGELGADDVIIPTLVPDGWTIPEPAMIVAFDEGQRDFRFRLSEPKGGLTMVVAMSSTAQPVPSRPPGTSDPVELAGIEWRMTEHPDVDPGTSLEARSGANRFAVTFAGVERSVVEAVLAGLRAGSKAAFPGIVVELDRSRLVATTGATTTPAELLASNGVVRMLGLAQDDWICTWLDLGPRQFMEPRCLRRAEFVAWLDQGDGIFELHEVPEAASLTVFGTITGSSTAVELTVRSSTVLARTGGANHVLDRQFYIAVLDGKRYVPAPYGTSEFNVRAVDLPA